MRFADFPLRDRKRARTRVALVAALVPRLAQRPLDDIGVAELCAEAEVSQGTFFNHFATKGELLTHYVQLWSLEVGLQARRDPRGASDPLAAIEGLYLATAAEVSAHPRVMLEIIAHQARHPTGPAAPIELVERLLFLDDAPEAEGLSDQGLYGLLTEWLGRAVAQGALPASSDLDQLTLAAASVFFGVPLLVGWEQPQAIGPLYQAQLGLVWAGAWARWGGGAPVSP